MILIRIRPEYFFFHPIISSKPSSLAMVAIWIVVKGQSTPPQKFFANALLSNPHSSEPSLDLSQDSHASNSNLMLYVLHKWLPSIAVTNSHMGCISQSFSWSLIVKFFKEYNKKDQKLGRPSVEDLHKHFVVKDFKQPFSLGLLDNRHAIIDFRYKVDFIHLYSRNV